ncbi:RasGEF domain containing protein [Trichomonas vaginalis G3]|uniref:RasGEF domain containing protein n=1 Tax=Trichomonas vaginalis (strain ATCC PRA-98 / G3) TaxID=412133 RepID=A2F7D3_TRIV3|nr:guanyl-nucleotide exchange factor protein [Trichomonas vaginalis G3]EAX99201.1 RasGEF domain containing protein [Trichomonas vaginalis G3]KAI5487960.1 guanyl-nucleotide exchange factor protein [Trichomonas vaginalis G3]|eukprot:XP_001312131.1 RasGEF domain containing protein [Trichomonas vaginalis G3]
MTSLPVNSILAVESKTKNRSRTRSSFEESSILANTFHEEEAISQNLEKDALTISSEFDMLRKNYFIEDGQDRSDWYSRFLNENKDAKDFIERVDPIPRAVEFARLYLPINRLASQDLLLALISQHFRTFGLIKSQASLHEEWSQPINIPAHLLRSQLTLLIQRGISHAERFWELSLPSPAKYQDPQKLIDQEISNVIGGIPFIAEDTTPLSNEQIGDERFIKYDETHTKIESASLNQLIWLLTSETKDPYRELMQQVCLTYRSFTTSKIFFTKIKERYEIALNEGDETRERSKSLTFKLFTHWSQEASEFIEQPVKDAAKAFAEAKFQNYSSYLAQLFKPRRSETTIDYSSAPSVELGTCTELWTGNFSLFDIPPKEFARQLTVYACSKYYQIQRTELIDGAWASERSKHRSPNIVALTNQFNIISAWVPTAILTEPSLQARLNKMKFLIDTMRELKALRNYFSLFAIHLGFNSSAIFRLQRHKKLLRPDDVPFLKELEDLGSPSGAYHQLLQAHKEAINSGQPALPHLPPLLSFLFKVNEAIESLTTNGLINMKRCGRTFEFMKQIESFARRKYVLLPIEQVQQKLMNLEYMEGESLEELSIDVEPADPNAELKDQKA